MRADWCAHCVHKQFIFKHSLIRWPFAPSNDNRVWCIVHGSRVERRSIKFNRFIILFKWRWQIKRYYAMCVIIYYFSVKRDKAIPRRTVLLQFLWDCVRKVQRMYLTRHLSYWHKEISARRVIGHTHSKRASALPLEMVQGECLWISQPPVYIAFNKLNKNNSNFPRCRSHSSRFACPVVSVVGVQSSKSFACTFFSLSQCFPLCSGISHCTFRLRSHSLRSYPTLDFSFTWSPSTYLSFSIHTVLILTIICARIIRFDAVCVCLYDCACAVAVAVAIAVVPTLWKYECNVKIKGKKQKRGTFEETLFQCIQKHKQTHTHSVWCMFL